MRWTSFFGRSCQWYTGQRLRRATAIRNRITGEGAYGGAPTTDRRLRPVLPPVDPKKDSILCTNTNQARRNQRNRRSLPVSAARPSALAFAPIILLPERASLERQLKGQGTSTLIEILEEAIEPWLKSHDYLL